MTVAIIEAPSNLGLRPPVQTAVPGCFKAPWALREAGLHARLVANGAQERGVVVPGRYIDDWSPGCGRVRNQAAIVDFSTRLASRIEEALNDGASPLLLGGDCSVLLGSSLALAARGRYGLVHLDGHSDFRHPEMSDAWSSVAGEDLAVAVGRHIPEIADIRGLGPYFDPADVVHVGCRDEDEGLPYMRAALAGVIPASDWLLDPDATAQEVETIARNPQLDGFWIHLDVDVLDPQYMPAVDSPDPGGVSPPTLVELLRRLAPHATGAQVCIYDPDLDSDGSSVAQLVKIVVDGLSQLGNERHRPTQAYV